MAEILSMRRWSERLLAIAVLISIAVVTHVAVSGNTAPAIKALDRQGVPVQPASAVTHHAHSKWRRDAVRSGGPLLVRPLPACATGSERSREYSGAAVTPKVAATVAAYDATAPPRKLLT